MSDGVYIPGISNKYNSQATIEKIMNKKREKLDDYNKDKTKIEDQQKNLGEVSGQVVAFDKLAKALYGISSPFDDKVAETGSDKISAKVNKNAEIGEYSVTVKQKAQAHRVAGTSLDRKYKVEAGTYRIGSGEKTAVIRFAGGTIEDFKQALSEQSNDTIKASLTYDTSKTAVLILESGVSGEKSRISFEDDKTRNLFKAMGFYEDAYDFNQEYPLSSNNTSLYSGKIPPQFDNNRLAVSTGNAYQVKLSTPVTVSEGMTLEIDLAERSKESAVPNSNQTTPTGPDFSSTGDTVIFDIQIPGEKPLVDISPYQEKQPEIKQVVHDSHYITLVTNQRKLDLDELDVKSDPSILKFNLSDLLENGETLTGIIIKNNDTEKTLSAGTIRAYDANSTGGIKFRNELAKPQDALVLLDGLQIKRSSNTIDDLLKGVTLNIFDTTNGETKLQVDRNYPKMVQAITDFLSGYNKLIDMINTKTDFTADDTVLSKEDKEKGKGVLNREQGLRTLASKLRIIMMNSYPTKYGTEFSMLSQVGISTNETTRGMSSEKLKGLLEFNEDNFADKFIEVMEKYPEGVKQIFGDDNDKDFVYDTGIGVEVNKLLKAYLEKDKGYFDLLNQSYKSDIDEKNKEIDAYKEKMNEEEQKLKEQFFKMEKAGQELEDNKKKFDNFNNN